MKIIIDAMSGDNAPQEIVAGAVKAADELGVEIVFVGRDKDVRACLGSRADQFEIVNAEDSTRRCNRHETCQPIRHQNGQKYRL